MERFPPHPLDLFHASMRERARRKDLERGDPFTPPKKNLEDDWTNLLPQSKRTSQILFTASGASW